MIYVRHVSLMCFYVDAKTLEAKSCSVYDPYAYSDPLKVPTMEFDEWCKRKQNAS